ncbi:hypothetical protein [Streptodolium elevatio]|uniref:Uncharacterized protein n=1 Tax=Streptodolium elevatio TaxID=3157996 RepID=A0ABV3DLG2_9ACTN
MTQVSAMTNIARLIAEDGELPPVNVDVTWEGHVRLRGFYAPSGERLTADEAAPVRDAWANALGIPATPAFDAESSGRPMRYFEAEGMWAGFAVTLMVIGELAPAEVSP